MENLFLLLFLVSFVCLIIGLVKPTVFSRFIKGEITRKKIGLIFGIATFTFFVLFGITTDTNKTKQFNTNEKFVKVISITGSQSGKSEEFVINSKEIKFVYRCDEGPFFCGGRLHQVGGANQELFRSSGNTGTLSEEKILSIGPGTFYIEIDTRDRAYKVDVFQSTTPASTEEIVIAKTKTDESKKYRNVSGFVLTRENMVPGILSYGYETNDSAYSVTLDVYDPKVTDSELERDYTLAKGSLKINGVDIQYAFNEGSKFNDVEIFKPYEDAEFTFVAGNQVYFGFVRKTDPSKTVDRAGIESTLKSFLNALVSHIQGG